MLSALLKLFPTKTSSKTVQLSGVNGFTGRGAIAYHAWSSGARRFHVSLKGIAGRQAEVYVDGARLTVIDLNNGRATKSIGTKEGDAIPDLDSGQKVEIHQNGHVILSGALNAGG